MDMSSAGRGLSQTQQQWITDYLDIDKDIFGDPVLAVMSCCHWNSAVHLWEDECDREYAGQGPRVPGARPENETHSTPFGIYVGRSLFDVLGREDWDHTFRCRNLCYKLADSIEYASLKYMQLPQILPYDFDEGVLLEYATTCKIRLSDAGWCRRSETHQERSPSCDTTDEPDWKEERRRLAAFSQGWSHELCERLRGALRDLPLQVDGDPVGTDITQKPHSVSQKEGDSGKKPKGKTGPKDDPKRHKWEDRMHSARKESGTSYAELAEAETRSVAEVKRAVDNARHRKSRTE